MIKNTGDILRNLASHIPKYLKKIMLLIQYKILNYSKIKNLILSNFILRFIYFQINFPSGVCLQDV